MIENKAPQNWILLRGLVRSKFHWKNFPDLLREQLKAENIFCVELPGNGYLYQEKSPRDASLAAEILRSQVPNEILSQPYGLIAISLGGMIASEWAHRFSNEVTHVVAINTSSKDSPFYKRLQPKNYLKIIQLLKGGKAQKTEEFILSATSNRKDIWVNYLNENVNFAEKYPVRTQNFLNQLKLATSANFRNKPKARCLILASKNDRLVHFECSQKIAELWECPIEFHDTAGHDLPLDDSNWIAQRIAHWLK
jgi:predicted alpha/beta hydrolase family esterase